MVFFRPFHAPLISVTDSKKKWSRDDISWPKFAVQLLQIPQMYQARGQSCPCDGFCICRTFLCDTSVIVYYFHCLLGLGKACATLWPPYLNLKSVSMSVCLSAITQLLLSRQLSDWTKSIGNCSCNYVKMCVCFNWTKSVRKVWCTFTRIIFSTTASYCSWSQSSNLCCLLFPKDDGRYKEAEIHLERAVEIKYVVYC